MDILRSFNNINMRSNEKMTLKDIALLITNSPRLRVAFNRFSGLPPESGVANPEERRFILYTSGKEVIDGVKHYADLGVKLNYVCVFYDRAIEGGSAGLPPTIKEQDILSYPDHEVVVFRNVDTLFAEAGLCYRLACLGVNYITRSNYRIEQRNSPAFAYPSILRERASEIERLFNLMADEQSKSDLAAYIKGRSLPSIGYHRIANFQEYYHPSCQASEGDTVIDAGLLDGMTSVNFGKAVGPSGRVYGFEPAPDAWDKILANFAKHPTLTLTLEKQGVWSDESELKFLGTHIVHDVSELSDAQARDIVNVKVGSIDRFVTDKAISNVDFLKMDIEGAEMAALTGSVQTIKRFRPKLAICVYHKRNDIFDIPFFIDSLDCGYRFYFATHSIGATSVVLYAVP